MTALQQVASTAGLLAGVAGISFAVWLQMITRRRVKVRYVAGLFLVGTALVLTNLHPVWPVGAKAARFLVHLTLLILETLFTLEVWANSPADSPSSSTYIMEVLDE